MIDVPPESRNLSGTFREVSFSNCVLIRAVVFSPRDWRWVSRRLFNVRETVIAYVERFEFNFDTQSEVNFRIFSKCRTLTGERDITIREFQRYYMHVTFIKSHVICLIWQHVALLLLRFSAIEDFKIFRQYIIAKWWLVHEQDSRGACNLRRSA